MVCGVLEGVTEGKSFYNILLVSKYDSCKEFLIEKLIFTKNE